MHRFVNGIDHLTLVVNELRMASTIFSEDLGFSIGETGYYFDNGTYYSAIHFQHGGHLELLAPYDQEVLGEDGISWFEGARGPGSLALSVSDIQEVMECLRSKDIMVSAPNAGTTHFDGVDEPPSNLWSAIGLMEDILPGSIYFIERNNDAYESLLSESPFLDPAQFTNHPNSAERIRSIWIHVEDIETAAMSFKELGCELSETMEIPHLDAIGVEVKVGVSSILLLESVKEGGYLDTLEPHTYHGVIGMTIEVGDLEKTCRYLVSRNIEIGERYERTFGESILLSSTTSLGSVIEFTSIW